MARDTLTQEHIVSTAIELLDEEGLEGLNMRSLGKRLDSAATAVYWHVKNKDNLVLLAADHVWHEIELPDARALGWREAAERLATGLHEMLGRHPWLVPAFGTHLFYGPGKARYDDLCLATYESAGFTEAEADRAAATVFTFVLGSALTVASEASLTRRLGRDGDDARARLDETMAKAAEVARPFPRLRARLDAPEGTAYAAAPEGSFAFGLRMLLGALEAEVAGRAAR
ncbi:TetR/AcrR family transcriptional regulator C-terminal domain-containing protein [Streptomyces sp. NPDC048606]|uniref:TetR/AcrR family transcriptional regulator C-terminal domain-containing protein n=1 Tax=Streptomyces sp. NPDC048606 TaxID=3154726 RepID=UPI0034365B91